MSLCWSIDTSIIETTLDLLFILSLFLLPFVLYNFTSKLSDTRIRWFFLFVGLFSFAVGLVQLMHSLDTRVFAHSVLQIVKILALFFFLGILIASFRILYSPATSKETDPSPHVQPNLPQKELVHEKAVEFEFLANTIPQLIWVTNANGIPEYYNRYYVELTGHATLDMPKWDWTSILHPDDIERSKQAWSDAVRTGNPYEIEYRFSTPGGQFRWFLGRALPMKDEKGVIKKWFGTCTDVHDFKLAEQELQESKKKLERVINTAPISLWSVNNEGIFTLSEGRALEILGYKPGEIVGLPHASVFPRPELGAKIQRALAGESFIAVNDIKNKTFETYYGPLTDENTGIIGMVGISVDVTQRRQAEIASALKSRFLANMSHELRTPLNAVIGFANVLKKTALDEHQKHYVQLINQSGELLLKLIGDVLDLTKIEEGKFEIEKESFQLKETVCSSLSPYEARAKEAGLEFVLLWEDEIPEYIIGDKHRINQVLINLIGNALKFTKEGKIQVTIAVLEKKDQQVRLKFAVADTGPGIPKEKLSVIFDSFTQADFHIHKEFGGSGLGLSIAKQVVNLMEGELHVESPHTLFSSPLGTCFWFILPFEIAEKVKIMEAEEKSPHFAKKMQVLVAEDNEVNQMLARLVLKGLNCETDFANNGKECITMLEEGAYDFILMDVQMPIMDGLEATLWIRDKLKNDIPIIGLSANMSKEDIEQSLRAGMNDHIGKPYSEEQLYSVIKKWVEK